MNKIQVSSGRSSAATHRLTQASTTLNRRYVHRPTNLAVEEAARAVKVSRPQNQTPTRPSRLVNLGVRSADLEAARAQEYNTMTAASETSGYEPITMYPQVIELGGIVPGNTEPVMSQTPTVPTQPEIDPKDLAMSIAADYAAASLGASMKEYGNNYTEYAMPTPEASGTAQPEAQSEMSNTATLPTMTTPDSVDAIAQAASEAIASIRTSTEPAEVSEQIASLKAFADSIKSNHNTPEMRELSDTIDKFVSIAMKSGKVQPDVLKKSPSKPALTSKATRAAAKVTKTSAKVMAKSRSRSMTMQATAAKPSMTTKSSVRAMSRPAKRLSPEELKERAIEQALESVATMSESQSQRRRQPAMHTKRKGGAKRFAIAFTCAAICVGGVIAFVSSNIPDISVRVAAMQTGITASYPSYIPRDYKLGDVFSESGKITMVFDGPNNSSFTLEEEKSSWDSSALLRNFVEANWGEDYATTHEQGITIYIAESTSDAVWVNGGVLYKITSSGTQLTKKQVRSIVTSL